MKVPMDDLWASVIRFDNLFLAWKKARKGKANKAAVLMFELDLEQNLLDLQTALGSGYYGPGEYRIFSIYERKPRLIAAAPFVDRVVHHALMNIIEQPLDKHFIHDCWACRRGKGVHGALSRYQRWAQRYTYVLKMDISAYFPSIDHRILKSQLSQRIMDPNVSRLMGQIIDSSPPTLGKRRPVFVGDDLLTPLERPSGLPIGNLTSQFFANLYLDDFDHWLKAASGTGAYLRYVDDMAVLSDDKDFLWALADQVKEQLADLRLHIHPHKLQLIPVSEGIDWLGFRLWTHRRRIRNDNGHRFARRLRRFAKQYAKGQMDWQEIDASVQSWLGHAQHGQTKGLVANILPGVTFKRPLIKHHKEAQS